MLWRRCQAPHRSHRWCKRKADSCRIEYRDAYRVRFLRDVTPPERRGRIHRCVEKWQYSWTKQCNLAKRGGERNDAGKRRREAEYVQPYHSLLLGMRALGDPSLTSPSPAKGTLLIIDALNPLCAGSSSPTPLPALLSSFLSPSTSLLAVYHTDIPLPALSQPYAPSPLILLRYLATTLLTTHNLSHILSAHAARSRSLVAPVFGLAENREGVLKGLRSAVKHNDGGGGGASGHASTGLVLELEHRRKSGRGVREWYFLPVPAPSAMTTTAPPGKTGGGIMLLEDYEAYRRITTAEQDDQGVDAGVVSTTFEIGLTERQRQDREGVVLPYFDAQKGGDGPGEGGRILYDFGSEDDFDEEEDEI
nr:elongator complex protein 5 [Quercus suber]